MTETITPAPDGGAETSTAEAGENKERSGDDRLGYLEAEAKKAFAQRDDLKAKLRDFEKREKEAAQAEAKRAAEAGEYKDAYHNLVKQWEEAGPKLQEYETLKAWATEEAEATLAAVPPEIMQAIPESLSISDRVKLAKSLTKHLDKKPTSPPVNPTHPNGSNGEANPYTAQSAEEARTLAKSMSLDQFTELRKQWRDKTGR